MAITQNQYTKIVQLTYPNVVKAEDFGIQCSRYLLSAFNISANNTVASYSICSDDVNGPYFSGIPNIGQMPNSLNSFLGPFMEGGLAGYPHTGTTGLVAWYSHITDTGSLLIFAAPHIGITSLSSVGNMVRRGQVSDSSTCGAVGLAVNRIVGSLSAVTPTELEFGKFDRQQYVLTDILFSNRTTRSALTAASTYGARMKIATDAIRDAGASCIYRTLSTAYRTLTAASSIFANKDVFIGVGTFINVDDGYTAYVDVTSFKKFNYVTGGFTDYTTPFMTLSTAP